MPLFLREQGITVRVHGREATLATFRRLSRYSKLMLAQLVTSTALAVHRGAVERLQDGVDTGGLRSSVHILTLEGGLAAAVGTNKKYAAFREFGTSREGARTNKQPLPQGYSHGSDHAMIPSKVLVPWVRRHRDALGVDTQEEIENMAFAVAFMIAARGGHKAKPFLGPAAEAEARPFERGVLAIMAERAPRKARGGG